MRVFFLEIFFLETIKIQIAKPEDHSIVTDITFDGKSYWGFSKEQLAEWKTDLTITPEYIKENETYLLVFENKIIGYYSYIKLNDAEIELDNLFLYQKYIGKGFGKLLMKDFLERMKISAVKSVILVSEPNAEKFYSLFGFLTYERKESKIKGRFLPKMRLSLSE